MAISLARMGSIPADNSDYYGVALARNNASAAARDARRKAAQDLQTGEIDLAAKALGQKELERTTSEAAQSRPIRSNFIINREQAEGIPIGIRSPNYVDDSRPATAPFGPTGAPAVRSPQERQTTIDLARVNPDYAEQFRNGQITERNGMEDRTRKQGFEDQTNIRAGAADSRAADDQRIQNRQLSDSEKQQVIANNLAWFNANTARTAADKKGTAKPIDAAKLAKLKGSTAAAINEIGATQDVLRRLQNHPGLGGLTGINARIPFDVKQSTVDAEAIRQQLTAKSAFAELQKMRANSPTGGALGQVSDREESMLSNAAAALQRGQSPEQFAQNLKLFNDLLESSKANLRDAFKTDYGEDLPDPADPTTDPEYQRLLDLRKKAAQ